MSAVSRTTSPVVHLLVARLALVLDVTDAETRDILLRVAETCDILLRDRRSVLPHRHRARAIFHTRETALLQGHVVQLVIVLTEPSDVLSGEGCVLGLREGCAGFEGYVSLRVCACVCVCVYAYVCVGVFVCMCE